MSGTTSRRNSGSSKSSRSSSKLSKKSSSIDEPILVYHESAHSIVFRDHLRRAVTGNNQETQYEGDDIIEPKIVPLKPLELGPTDVFDELLESKTADSPEEAAVLERLANQKAAVKTIKNSEWKTFLQRFETPVALHPRWPKEHADRKTGKLNSFVTSTSLLPTNGLRMRCFGSVGLYTVGVVFGLPESDEAASTTQTWSWPAGYSAKTEFNIDSRGKLINGRAENLRDIATLRSYNDDYIQKSEYMVANRLVSGLSQIPYNELYLRVGGDAKEISYENGVGLPIALFVRTATFGHLLSLLRTRARLVNIMGEELRSIPLLFIQPDVGVRVLTSSLERRLWQLASASLTPFQNSSIAHRTTVDFIDEEYVEQKIQELINLDELDGLTPTQLASIAGGFGATDASVRHLLQKSTSLQKVVNQGLESSIRAGDFHTSKQLLLLYSLVASKQSDEAAEEKKGGESDDDEDDAKVGMLTEFQIPQIVKAKLTVPPPLDTDRLRSATNSDGLLAVLGAAQVLKVMKTGVAKERAQEVVGAVEEWVDYGEQSMAFRISSWYDQKISQGDLKIATDSDTKFMAFVSNKAITNRRKFANQLKTAIDNTDFENVRFLLAIHKLLTSMHSPCLRLELLQYTLGLDNRYSVLHVQRSVELAVSCLSQQADKSKE